MASKKKFGHGMSEKEGSRIGGGQFAGMPTELNMSMYPKAHEAGPMVENDTMSRVDMENKQAHGQTRKYLSNQH